MLAVVLRLYAGKDRLRIREVEDRMKIQKLLGLSFWGLVSFIELIFIVLQCTELMQPIEHEAPCFRMHGDPPFVQLLPKNTPTAHKNVRPQQ